MFQDTAFEANDYFNRLNIEDGHLTEEGIASTNVQDQTEENNLTSTNSADAATSLVGQFNCNLFSKIKYGFDFSKEKLRKDIVPESISKSTQINYDTRAYYNHGVTVPLNNALEYFEIDNCDHRNNGNIGEKKNSEKYNFNDFGRNFNHRRTNESIGMKTLGDFIEHFRLSKYLQELEASLEDVRRNKIEKEMHEDLFKQIDKEIQKLSFKYHPDKVKNRGGTEAEIKKAQKEQAALNSIRTALKILNSEFLDDMATDHKFEYYIGLHIDTICNEDAMQNRIFEVILRTGILTRIKQQNIIFEISEFLKKSEICIQSYLNDATTEFKAHRNSALFHLKLCIEGFEKLCKELDKIKDEYKSEEDNESMLVAMQKMAADYKRNVSILKSLQNTTEAARKGNYQFFNPTEGVDSYYVLPFVCYVNVILMCNVMVRTSRFFDNNRKCRNNFGPTIDQLKDLEESYYLTSYYIGNHCHKSKVSKILGKIDVIRNYKIDEDNVVNNQVEVELKFRECIKSFIGKIENEFKVEYYTVTMAADLLVKELNKCITLMSEFEEKERKLSKQFQEFQEQTEKIQQKYAEVDKIMKAADEMGQIVKDRLEKSRKCRESLKDIY